MNKHYLSRTGFEALFEECMNQKEIYFPDGTSEEGTPSMTIRDFDTANKMDADNDREFFLGDLDKAWEYFKTIDRIRIMSLNGTILMDAFDDSEVN